MQNSDYSKKHTQQPKLEDSLLKWEKMKRYSQWMYSTFKPYVGKRILDIGIGVGNITQFYIEQAEIVVGTDIFDSQLKIVEERFAGHNIETMLLDIEKDNMSSLMDYKFDTIICVTVLEHINDELQALNRMKAVIPSEGRIILMVPALSKLYCYMDKSAGHYRRYDKGQLANLAKQASLKILEDRYFNFFGILPYAVKGLRGGNGTFSDSFNTANSSIYNIASYVLEPIEKMIKIPAGIQEVVVLEKN